MFLADRVNLQAIHDAPVLVMDGTFDYRPQHFDQTYTLHAVFSNLPNRQSSFLAGNMERLQIFITSLGIAFLPGRTQAIYTELFTQLRSALMAELGSIGDGKLILMDCEIAAHNAVEAVFPEFRVRSCYFHFTKNVLDYAKTKGLTELLHDEEFSHWISAVLGIFCLTTFLI